MIEAGNSFYEEFALPGTFNNDAFVRRMMQVIEDSGVIFGCFKTENGEEVLQGEFAAVPCECPFTGDMMAVEMFWYMLPRHRGGSGAVRLLQAYHEWVVECGFARCAMIHLLHKVPGIQPEKLQKLYEQMGYVPTEINYIKNLCL